MAAQSSAVITSSPLPAEEHDLVAGPHRFVVAAVDDDLVHRHHAGQGAAHPADEHLAALVEQAPGHTVGVADGRGRHGGRLGEGPASTVGRPLAGLEVADVGDPRSEGEDDEHRKQ